MANRNGIPRIEATGVNISSTAVTFSFQRNAFYNRNFAGLIIFRLPAYTAPTTAVPVIFDTDGESQAVTTIGGAAAYLTGYIGQLMFPKAKRFLCKCHCE